MIIDRSLACNRSSHLTDLASEGSAAAAASVIHFDLPADGGEARPEERARFGSARCEARSMDLLRSVARKAPLRFVARKGRLANRFLEAIRLPRSAFGTSRFASPLPGRAIVVEDGALRGERAEPFPPIREPCALANAEGFGRVGWWQD
jgi:hypothetical protein